jgi:gas vesicle protein
VTDERHDAAFVVGAVVGGLAGALYTLFNVPRAGASTRADLVERWNDGLERMAQGMAALDEQIRQRSGGGSEAVLSPPNRPVEAMATIEDVSPELVEPSVHGNPIGGSTAEPETAHKQTALPGDPPAVLSEQERRSSS